MAVNAAWHKANPMPKKPKLDQRIRWHLAHSRECGCRQVPAKLREEIKRRGLA